MNQEALKLYHDTVEGLHANWLPHPGQIKVARALFIKDIRSIFIECGRKWGKTEEAIYLLWRWAVSNPGANCYYIAPLLNQAREIVWADPRLQNFGPRDWLLDGSEGINNTEMRLRFKNGSFIKVDGSDNYDKHRGTRPHILVYEEFKDHRKQFREIMRPNLSVYNAPEIFIGTPPEDTGDEEENEFLRTAKEHKETPGKLYHWAPTHENPHIDRKWLEDEKARLIARGEADVWEREYMARFVKGGARKIFPMFSKEFVRPHAELIQAVSRDRHKLRWVCFSDPGTVTTFGVLFLAYNPESKQLYILDEIYETNSSKTTVAYVGPLAQKKRQELYSPRPGYTPWYLGYDEAAAWFSSEMAYHFKEHWIPSEKSYVSKENGIALIKDIFLQNKVLISDRCVSFYKELDSYQKTDRGVPLKEKDHLIDCWRYALNALRYYLTPIAPLDPFDQDDKVMRYERLRV